MIREMGNVELFELRETIPKVQSSGCLLIGIKELSFAHEDISWLNANPANIFTNGDWMEKEHKDPHKLANHVLHRKQKWKKAPGYGVLGPYASCCRP